MLTTTPPTHFGSQWVCCSTKQVKICLPLNPYNAFPTACDFLPKPFHGYLIYICINVLLGQTIWHSQFKRQKIYLSLWFQCMVSWFQDRNLRVKVWAEESCVPCNIQDTVKVGRVRERGKGTEAAYTLQRHILVIYFLQLHPPPGSPFGHEFINGLIHWWGYSLQCMSFWRIFYV